MIGLLRLFAIERIRRSVANLVVLAMLATAFIPAAAAEGLGRGQAPAPIPMPVEPAPVPILTPQKPKPVTLPAEHHTGEIIVRFKEQPSPESMELIGLALSAHEFELPARIQVVRSLVADGLAETLAALRADPNVEFAELNYLFRAAASTNDPQVGEQWAVDEVAAGWGWAKGATYLGGSIAQAAPVTVAVVDTGVDTAHEDLVDRLLPGRNVITGAPDPSDVFDDATDGHGTHAAGVIAATTENGIGMAGLAGVYPVSILPVKALNADGLGSMLDIANGIRWAADRGATVINLSFGSRLPDYPVTLAEAVKYAQDQGALVVAAAGNEGGEVAGYYPASLPGVVAAAASGRDHRPAIFTNKSEVMAPGLDVLSTLPGNQYGTLSGTSVSAAMVSGVAAVLRSVFPAKSRSKVVSALQMGHAPYSDGYVQYKVLSMTLALDALNGSQTTPNSITFIQPTEFRIHGTTQFVAQMKDATGVDYVQFRLSAAGESQLLGTVQGDLQSGTFELTWDSTLVPDGPYTIYAEALNAENVILATGSYWFNVYNAAESGLTLQVVKPDGTPAAGAAVTVYYAETKDGPLQTLFEGNADLEGNLAIPGAQATDGNEFLVVAQGSDPAFLYARSVVTPAFLTLDATDAYPVTFVGRDGVGDPAVGATVWAGLIAGPNFLAVTGKAPLVTLGGDGIATATVSQGQFTFRQFSRDLSQYQVERDVIINGESTVSIQPPAGGLASLTISPQSSLIQTYGTTWTDGDGFVLPVPKGDAIAVTPGLYSAAIRAEVPDTYFKVYYDFTVPPFVVTAGEERMINFGGPLRMTLAADQSGPVTAGSKVSFTATVTDAAGNLLRVGQPNLYATYNGYTNSICCWPDWQISPYTSPGTYSVYAEWGAGPLGPSATRGYIKSDALTFDVVSDGVPKAPLTVNLIGKNGGPVFGQVFLLTKTPGGYTRVTSSSINNGVASFSSGFSETAEHAVILSGAGPVSSDPALGWGSIWLFAEVPAGPAPASVTLDLNQVNLRKIQLQALNEQNQPFYAQHYAYLQGTDGTFAGGQIETDVWVPEGRYLFQAVKTGINGSPDEHQYNLFSSVIDLSTNLPADGRISFGGSDQLTRLSTSLDDPSGAFHFSALAVFPTNRTGIGSPRFASAAPIYVTPGRYSVEALLQRWELMDNWAYWLAHSINAVGGQSESWQYDTTFTAAVSLDRTVLEPNSSLITTNLVLDGQGNRLVRMALNPQFGGVHLTPTGDPHLLAPFLVIKDQSGQEVYRAKELDPLAEDGRYYAAWGGCMTGTCPMVAPTTGPSSFFGQTLIVPGAWTGGSYTAQIELGVGPGGPVYAAPVSFTVSSAPVLDPLPAATQEGQVIVSGTTQASASVAISYTFESGPAQEAGMVTAGDDGRFNLPVALTAEGAYAFTAVATLDGKSSLPSGPVTIVSDRTAPGAPVALTWTSPDLNHIRLSWAAPAEADLVSYELWRGETKIADVPATGALSFQDEGLEPNTAYTYHLYAIDWAGNRSAAATVNAATGTVADAEPPSAPANLQGVLTEPFTAQLTWEAALDNVAVTGYNLYRAEDGGAPVLLATVTDGLTYQDSQLTTGTAYSYSVTAIDGAGNESAPSATVQLTTAAMVVEEVQVRIRPLTRFGSALPGATVQLTLTGDPFRQADAIIRYQTWTDEAGALLTEPRDLELLVPLTATAAAPDTYTGTTTLPIGAAAVVGVTGRLTDGAKTVTHAVTAGMPQSVIGTLAVQLLTPADATDADVIAALAKGAKLTLWSDSVGSGGQLSPTGPGEYLIPELTPAGDYQLRLVTDGGWELARLTGITVYGGYQQSVALTPRLPATVQLQVFDVDGTPKAVRGTFRVDGGTDLTWSSDASGLSNLSIGRWAGETVTYWVFNQLPYVKDQTVTVTLKPGHNLATLPLQQYPKGQIQGTAVRRTDNTPIADVTVSVHQVIDGTHWNASTKTDANGFYSLSVYAGEATLEAANATGMTRTLDPVTVTVPADGTATQDLLLSTRGTGTILVDIYTRAPGGDWQGPILLDWRQAVHYRLRATTKTGSYSGYPLKPMAMDGETVKVCVNGEETKLPDQCQEAVFDDNLNARVEFRLDGTVVSPIVLKPVDDRTGAPVTFTSGAVFPMASTTNWRRPAVQLLTNGSTDLRLLENGTYEVVLVGTDGQVGTARFNSVLGESKEVEVRMNAGRYFQGREGNDLFVSQTEFGLESYLTFRAQFTNHGPALRNAAFRLNAPGTDSSYFQSVIAVIDGVQTTASMTASGNYEFWIGEIAAGQSSTVSYTVRVNGALEPYLLAVVSQASLRYTEGESESIETIGIATVPYHPVSIDVPAAVNQQEIVVAGNASPVGGLLTVYAGDLPLGTVTVEGAGKWSLPITLPGTATKVRTHQLRAEVKDPVRGEAHSATTTVKYDPNAVIMESISMTRQADDGSTVGITIDPGTVVPTFPFVLAPGRPVTVAIDFSDPDRVINPTAEIPGMGKVTLQRGPDGLFRGEFATWYGSPGALYTSYETEPLPFEELPPPTLEDMRESLSPALYNSTLVSRSSSSDDEANQGSAYASMILNLDGDPSKQVALSMSLTPPNLSPEELEEGQKAAGGLPAWGLALDHDLDTRSLSGYVQIGSGGLTSIGPFTLNPIHVGTKAFEVTMKVLGPSQDLAQVMVAPASLSDVDMQMRALLDQAQGCGWHSEWYVRDLENLYYWYVEMQVILGAVNIIAIVGISTGIGTAAGAMFSIAGFALGYAVDKHLAKSMEYIKERMDGDPLCNPDDSDSPNAPPRKTAKPKWIMDPGGYVYEAVPENRLAGVTTTLLEKQADGSWLFWDSEWYGQKNPLTTNAEGLYAWDVPEGDWQVVYEKEGYLTETSPSLHVPPPQTEVHQAMVSLASPEVQAIMAGQDGAHLDVLFTQYMKAASLTGATVVVTLPDGTPVEGDLTPLNPVTSNTGLPVTRVARFNPAQPLAIGGAYLVDVSELVQNYAERTMAAGLIREIIIPADVTAPGQVSGLTVTPGDGSLTLHWRNPADADFSHVRLAWSLTEYGRWVETRDGGYTITGLANGVTYSVKLVTVDAAGNESEAILVAGKPVDTTAPRAVTAAEVLPGAHQLTVVWTDPLDLDLAKIRVEWTGSDGAFGNTVLSRGTKVFQLENLADEVTYQFTLTAIDQVGNASEPVTVSGTTPDVTAPGQVTGAQATVGDTKVSLTWTDPTDDDFAKVQITWQGGSAELAKGAQQYEVTGLTNGTVYEFKIVTVDEVGNASAPVTLTAMPVPPDVLLLDVVADQGPAKFETPDLAVALQLMPKSFAGPVSLKVTRLGWPTWPDRERFTPVTAAFAITSEEALARPLTITLRYDQSLLRDGQFKRLALFRQDANDPTQWILVDSAVNPGEGYLRADVDALGVYAVMLVQ